MKIVIDNKIPYIKGVFEPYAEVVYLPGAKTTAEDVRDADAIVTRTRTACNASLLEGSKVKIIATATIGFDHIDTQWCESNGIIWKSAPGCNSGSVKQYISSALVSLCEKHHLRFRDVTLGVVGVGNVGSKVASAATAMGMTVLLNDPPRARKEGSAGFVSLDEIIDRCDIITVHVPLNRAGEDRTVHLFDEVRIAEMRPDQIIINSSRGPVVDNVALKEALLEKRLRGAVLDVWEGEPDLDEQLVNLLDLSTPHIAGYSADGKANGAMMSVRSVAEALGLPLTQWTPECIPVPPQATTFGIYASPLTDQEVITEAVLHTYDVASDSAALRTDISSFERLRGDYAVRREFQAFTVELTEGTLSQAETLRKLGFNIIEN